MPDVDMGDPCARAADLSAAYYRLLKGEQEEKVRSRSGESETEVSYTAANLDALRNEMLAAQDECARLKGLPSPRRRFAITSGSRGGPGLGGRYCP